MGKKGKKKEGGGEGDGAGRKGGGQGQGGQSKPPQPTPSQNVQEPPSRPAASTSERPGSKSSQRGDAGRSSQEAVRADQQGGGRGDQQGGGRGGQQRGERGDQQGGGRGDQQGGGRGGQQGGGRGDQQGGGRGVQQGGGRGVQQGGGRGVQQGGGRGVQQGGGRGDQQGGGRGGQQGGGRGVFQESGREAGRSVFHEKGRAGGTGGVSAPQESSGAPFQSHPQPASTEIRMPVKSPTHSLTPSSSSSSISAKSEQQKVGVEVVTKKVQEMSINSLQIPRRKGTGSHGRATQLEVNHFSLKFRDDRMKIYHYDVVIQPEKPFRMYKAVMVEYKKRNCPNNHFGFDGKKNIFTNIMLDSEKTDFFKVYDEEKSADHPGIDYTVTVKYASEFRFSKLLDYLNDGSSLSPPQIVLQALDVVLRHAANSNRNYVQVGRSYFSRPSNTVYLGNGLNLWYGFYQSAILGWKPFLNVDVAHKGFPVAVNCVESLKNFTDNVNRELDRYAYQNFRQYIKGLKIVYQLPNMPNSKRTYKISDLAEAPDKNLFSSDKENGKEMYVSEYFAKKKNYKLKYPHLPCLQAGPKTPTKNVCLPMELCTIMEGQIVNKKLDEKQTSVMVRNAAQPPHIRKRTIMNSLSGIKHNQDCSVNQFGITVNSEFEKVPARVLPPPTVCYKEKTMVKNGVWNPGQFLQGVDLMKWAIVCVDDRTNMGNLDNLEQVFIRNGPDVGLKVGPAFKEILKLKRYEDLRQPLLGLFKRLQDMFKNDIQLIVVIISPVGEQYGKVKQVAELHSGVLTQCLKAKTVQMNLNKSTVTNILLKVNAKLNGVNHRLDMRHEARFNFLSRPVIIMGADVTHPSPDQREIPSVAAVTASIDKFAFKYTFEWRLQPGGVEIISDLENIIISHLKSFYRLNHVKPERIIFYRDGVSEGQFYVVLNEEIKAIRRACKRLELSYEPAITFLVVQKRHHTRLFPIDSKDFCGKHNNIPPGTVVDQIITHPTEKEFYLNSHAGIQGTSRPTKYHVLWDDSDLSMDELQVMTYYLCHLFTRCARTVSYPTPTYYAHFAAFRIRAYCEGRSMNLDDFNKNPSLREVQNIVIKNSPMFFV